MQGQLKNAQQMQAASHSFVAILAERIIVTGACLHDVISSGCDEVGVGLC